MAIAQGARDMGGRSTPVSLLSSAILVSPGKKDLQLQLYISEWLAKVTSKSEFTLSKASWTGIGLAGGRRSTICDVVTADVAR